MHFVFLGKQVLTSMKFYVCEGFLTLFLFINKQSDVWASSLNLLFPRPRNREYSSLSLVCFFQSRVVLTDS